MSKENVQGFYDSAKENGDLQKALLEAAAAGNVVALAKEKGFEFTQAEHDEFIAVIAEGMKLSDDQLEEVSGGFHIPVPKVKYSCRRCNWNTGWKYPTEYTTCAAMMLQHGLETSNPNDPNSAHKEFKCDEAMK